MVERGSEQGWHFFLAKLFTKREREMGLWMQRRWGQRSCPLDPCSSPLHSFKCSSFLRQFSSHHIHQPSAPSPPRNLHKQEQQLLTKSTSVATLASLLRRCAEAKALARGTLLHSHIKRYKHHDNVFLGNWLILMYGECERVEEARAVFDHLPNPNLHSWTILIKAYAMNNCCEEALECFDRMQVCGVQPNRVTFIAAVDACVNLGDLEKAQKLHEAIRKRGYEGEIVVGTALVSMYGKCGSIDEARAVFERMPQRNVVSWTAMIDACVRNGHGQEALNLFQEMQTLGIKPNQVTFLCIIDACGIVSSLEEARQMHAFIVESGCQQTLVINTALVDMYGKCGSAEDARIVFKQISKHDVVSWNAIIAACVQSGHGEEALGLFHQMCCDGIEPNHVTFLNVLTACSHMGRVDEGTNHFASMSEQYGLTPKVEHYLCLVDMLGRAGKLDAAEDLINHMPFKNEASVWLSLLGACRIHRDVERGIRAAKHAVELDPKRAAPYLLLSNIYGSTEEKDDLQRYSWK